jgi:cell division protein FtsB
MIKSSQDKKKSKKVVNKEENKNKNKPKNSSNGFYYSFLTIILLLCLVQIAISAILNVSKVISYKAKIVQIEKTRNVALTLNEQLKENIKNFSNASGLEAIARNNLKMSSEDEVLVIINATKEEKTEKTQKTGFTKHD